MKLFVVRLTCFVLHWVFLALQIASFVNLVEGGNIFVSWALPGLSLFLIGWVFFAAYLVADQRAQRRPEIKRAQMLTKENLFGAGMLFHAAIAGIILIPLMSVDERLQEDRA